MSSSNLINRETLANGTIRQMALDRDGPDSAILTEEELLESRRSFFPDDYDKDDWLFGYGSLIWNPVCLLYTSPSPRDLSTSRMPSSA